MWKTRYSVFAALIVMILLALACVNPIAYIMDPDILTRPTVLSEEEKSETQIAIFLGVGDEEDIIENTPTPAATATSEIEVSDIQPGDGLRPREGTCAWVLTSNSDGYPSGWVNEDMRVLEGDIESSLRTKFWHGKPGCNDQVFGTYHGWGLEKMYSPSHTYNMIVVFTWENIGTADCASLAMAGGVTSLSVDLDSFQVKAQWSNINIRTNPTGGITDDGNWKPPEGKVGDIMTITQHFNTGSYGKNIRWRYEYVCE